MGVRNDNLNILAILEPNVTLSLPQTVTSGRVAVCVALWLSFPYSV